MQVKEGKKWRKVSCVTSRGGDGSGGRKLQLEMTSRCFRVLGRKGRVAEEGSKRGELGKVLLSTLALESWTE